MIHVVRSNWDDMDTEDCSFTTDDFEPAESNGGVEEPAERWYITVCFGGKMLRAAPTTLFVLRFKKTTNYSTSEWSHNIAANGQFIVRR